MTLHALKREIEFSISQVQMNTACHIHSSYSDYRFRIFVRKDGSRIFQFGMNYMGSVNWQTTTSDILESWGVRNCTTHHTVNCPFDATLIPTVPE